MSAPYVVDPLREISPLQRASNRSRKWVLGSKRIHLSREDSDGKPTHALRTDAQGRRTQWELCRPEPSAAHPETSVTDLDQWAAELGMRTDTEMWRAHSQERVLILVRALKITFGRDVEDEDVEDFAELLRGAAALERMWRDDPSLRGAGLFTLDAFQRAVAAHPDGRKGVDQVGYRQVLAAATQAAPGTGLTAFVTMPAVEAALRWLDGRDPDEVIREVLEKDRPGETQLLRVFWARVKAYDVLGRDGTDAVALARRVLHLESAETVDEARLEELRWTLTRAFAEGRDAADPDVAAAYHLQHVKLLGSDTSLSTLDLVRAARKGRDFTGESPRPVVDLAYSGSDGRPSEAPWLTEGVKSSRPDPYLVRAKLDPADPNHLLLVARGRTWRVTQREFIELLAEDPVLQNLKDVVFRRSSLRVDVVLDIPELDRLAPGMARRLAQRLGRHVWSTALRTKLRKGGRQGSSVLGVRDRAAASGTSSGVTWTESQPEDPAEPVESPGSIPDPVPEHAPLPGEAAPSAPAAAGASGQRAGMRPAVGADVASAADLDTGADTDTASDTDSEFSSARPADPGPRNVAATRVIAMAMRADAPTRLADRGRTDSAWSDTASTASESSVSYRLSRSLSVSSSASVSSMSSISSMSSVSSASSRPDPGVLDAARKDAARKWVMARSGAGQSMPGLEMTGTAARPASAPHTEPVAAKPVQPLPEVTLVPFAAGSDTPADSLDLQRLIVRVAETGLRNRALGVSLPDLHFTGYGADAPRDSDRNRMRSALRLGTERAEAAQDEFLAELDDELADRQSGVPAELRLHASDFVTRATGQVRLPEGDPVIAALAGTAGAADIERQATLEFLYDPETAAVETLDKLRGQDRRLDGRPLDLDAATRRILHLTEDAEVSAEQRAELYALCWDAREAGRATSMAALAVFHLERTLGVLAPRRKRHFTQGMSTNRTYGLNWSEKSVTGLDTTRLRTRDLDSSTTYTEHWSGVPWRKTPQAYVVAGDMRDGKYVVRPDDGREVLIDFEEFAELVALDVRRQKLRRGTPIVLAIPFAGDGLLDGPRLLAHRTGMTVFAHSAEVGLAQPDGTVSTALVVRRKGSGRASGFPAGRVWRSTRCGETRWPSSGTCRPRPSSATGRASRSGAAPSTARTSSTTASRRRAATSTRSRRQCTTTPSPTRTRHRSPCRRPAR